MIEPLIWLLVAVAVVSIVYWAITQIPLPPPGKVVAIAILAIVALVVITKLLLRVMAFV